MSDTRTYWMNDLLKFQTNYSDPCTSTRHTFSFFLFRLLQFPVLGSCLHVYPVIILSKTSVCPVRCNLYSEAAYRRSDKWNWRSNHTKPRVPTRVLHERTLISHFNDQVRTLLSCGSSATPAENVKYWYFCEGDAAKLHENT